MQSDAGGRYIHSVSDLCGADEIEFLLDDIRDLEAVNYRAEDIQVRKYPIYSHLHFKILISALYNFPSPTTMV